MKFLCSEKISEHKYKTPEGYLVCVDSVLARTGKQTYKRSEVFGDSCKDANVDVDIDRPAKEVFSDMTLASFENKPLTVEHPDEDVNTGNHRELSVGFARDIKRGKDNGEDVMLGTLVFTDAEAIEAIESGEMTELSCGYDCDIVDEENPCQRNIRGNHIALCKRGRAGIARIVDSKVKDDSFRTEFETFLKSKVDFRGPHISKNYYIYTMKRPYYTVIGEIRTWLLNKNVNFKIDKFPDDVDILISKQNMQDSVKDNLELPEDEDSTFMYRDAYGKEIIVTNWDGGSVFLVEYDGTEQQMNRRDIEHYLDRKGARFSRVLRDSIKDAKWYDPEYDRYVTEDIIKKQYEKMKQTSAYFKQSYEKFREENFIEVKPGMERYYDSVKDVGSHREQLAQQEYNNAKQRLDHLYEQRRKANLSGGGGMKFEPEIAQLEKKIDKLKADFGYALEDSMKDADFSKQSKQGYQVIEMYRDAGRLHAILKRSNDYVIAYGYDTSDGTWAQGRYDFSTLDKARQALQEEKKYARRIEDVDTYEEATNGLKKQAKKALDSKEDILQKLRSTQIREGDTFEMRDGQYLVQIQNVGKQTIEFKGNNWRVGHASIKESSWAWGRIWKNGTILFNETDALNIVRDKMIAFMKTVRDSVNNAKDSLSAKGGQHRGFKIYRTSDGDWEVESPDGEQWNYDSSLSVQQVAKAIDKGLDEDDWDS